MDLLALRHFVTVAEELYLTRAAQRLQISITTVSRSVSGLEREIGVALLQRCGRNGVGLTDAGHVFVDFARKALALVEYSVVRARIAAMDAIGELRVGVNGDRMDVGVVCPLIAAENYRLQELAEERSIAALPAGHSLASSHVVPYEALSGEPLVLCSRNLDPAGFNSCNGIILKPRRR